MPIGKIKSVLRDKKDHYVITLYKDFRIKHNIKINNILLLSLNGKEFIRRPNSDFHLTIPKKIAGIKSKKIKLNVLKVWEMDLAKARNKLEIKNGLINNIGSLTPLKTIFNNDIYCLDSGDNLYIWYSVGGGANYVKIKKCINLERLAELVGFYFGDGNTSDGIRSFRINNCEPSALNYSLKILNEMGIGKESMKCQIIFSTPNESLDNETIDRCVNFWSKTLGIRKKQIVSVSRSKGKTESLKYGSARLFLDNCSLVELIVNGVLPTFVDLIKDPKTMGDKIILKGFLRGLAAAEGSVTLTKLNSLSKVGFSYDPHSNDLEFYKKILSNIGINYGGTHGNELLIYGMKNFKIFMNLDLFKMHQTRDKKFKLGYKNHKFS
jgi:hypothetical protein